MSPINQDQFAGAAVNPPASPWLACWQRSVHAKLRLIAFPYAGGGAVIFQHWRQQLPQWLELHAVRLPARESRFNEPPCADMDGIVTAITDAMLDLQPPLPTILFGHSLGATLAFEVARILQRLDRPIRHLLVSARHAPREPSDRAPTYNLPDAELVAELKRLNGVPPSLLENDEFLQLVLPRLRADFALAETYVYRPTGTLLRCPISALTGSDDDSVQSAHMAPWRAETGGQFQHHDVIGDHFFIHSAEAQVLQLLREVAEATVSGAES